MSTMRCGITRCVLRLRPGANVLAVLAAILVGVALPCCVFGKDEPTDGVIRHDYTLGSGDGLLWRKPFSLYFGTLVIAGDKLLVGVGNDTAVYDPARPDESVLACLSAADGKQIWRVSHPRLPSRLNDLPSSPIASRPAIDKDRIYYVSNRGELCCLSLAQGKKIWTLDTINALGVFKRDPSDVHVLMPSPIIAEGRVFCVKGNGNESLAPGDVPRPDAPSFIAVDKTTGRVAWSSNAPGKRIAYGQWGTPAAVDVGGVHEVLFPGGDGLVYSFDRQTGKELWKIDLSSQVPSPTRSFVVAPMLINGTTAFVSVSRDLEQSGAPRPFFALSLDRGAIQWRYLDKDFDGTLGEIGLDKTRVYFAGTRGVVVALDRKTGKEIWRRDLENMILGGVCLAGDKLYVTSGESVYAIQPSNGRVLAEYELGRSYGLTPVVRDGRMYVGTSGYLWCVQLPD